jgi:hypothetical protein
VLSTNGKVIADIQHLDAAAWENVSENRYTLSGILEPGDYMLHVDSEPQNVGGHAQYTYFADSDFDFQLAIPSPSALAVFVAPVGLAGLRRRSRAVSL